MYHKFAKCITESVPAYSLLDYRSIFPTQELASGLILKMKRQFLILIFQILIISILSSIDLIYHILWNTVSQPTPHVANGILKYAKIVIPQNYLINFWRSLGMPLINCKVELKLYHTKCTTLINCWREEEGFI